MPLRTPRSQRTDSQYYEARLAREILAGSADAPAAAMSLLEHVDPPTLDTAARLVADQGPMNARAFDLLADAWESYRHLKNLSWD